MMNQRRVILIALWCALGTGLAVPRHVSAQTLEIQEEVAGSLMKADPTGIGYLKWVWRWANVLGTEIDTTQFQGPVTLKEALDVAYDHCADKEIELNILIDHRAFGKRPEHEQLLDVQVNLSALPRRVPLSRLLMEMLDQLSEEDATIVLHYTFLEITTVREAGRSGLSFHIARRIAPIVRFWWWGGLAAALVFVTIRTRSIWRRPDGRVFGIIVMILGAVLVWLFWPIWLLIAGISLVRKRNPAPSSVAR